ncbi:unnamed protein product [Microthlaspi erraticum]|uniref:TIR domain-containing protein n=1 Tax=Microthlaspi erraticum TaxID=1685480 RepID=A0A6D2JKQ1_9BRAS|nr:unnamed protein product [Microthlaspi erraticum]
MASSSSKAAINDVFIGYVRDSTCSSIVSHLSAAFRRKNISVVEEDDDPPSESSDYVSQSTKLKIKRSKICVVVVTEELVYSNLGMSTLSEVIDGQHGENCLPVVPVFYGINRAVVKRLSNVISHHTYEHKWRNARNIMVRPNGSMVTTERE